MIIVTTDTISGKTLQHIGIVTGSTVQSKNIGHDILSSLKTIVGGELESYTDMMDEARNIAINRMIKSAQSLGADAIVGMRFSSSAVAANAAEIICYGTAVKFI